MSSRSNKGGKTIPAELAIMRELAYRRMLFLISQNTDSTQQIIPSQVKHSCEVPHSQPLPSPSTKPSSSLLPSGTKGKETSSADHHHRSLDHKAETKNIYCKISQVKSSCQLPHPMPLPGTSSKPSLSPFLSRSNRNEPTSNPHHPHLQYQQQKPLHGSLNDKEKTETLDGKLCQAKSSCEVPCSMSLPGPSSSPLLSGTKRKEPTRNTDDPSLQSQQPFHGSLDHEDKTQNVYCEICRVSCSSPFNLKQHIRGQNHAENSRVLEFSENAGKEGSSNQRKWCEMCEVSCPNEALLKLHFDDYNIREYTKRRAIDAFHQNRNLSETSSISSSFSDGKSQLDVAKRQAYVYSLYAPPLRSVMELENP
ncbi:unnamed protein product [Lupinus luteus]|uniref:C2H2-type domain-containing protein n=1 Tax=Lupinus luteus TaxID=3873 RepID=A0AAV1WZA5_LUPLU